MLKADDLIIAVGKTTTKDGIIETHYTLAHVVDVGKSDIFAKEDNKSRVFKIPAKSCLKISVDNMDLSGELISPMLGDLVLSLTDSYSGKIDKKMGVLMEIIDVPGKYKMSKILSGDSLEIVSYDSLIVLE